MTFGNVEQNVDEEGIRIEEREEVLSELVQWRMQIENEHFTTDRSPEESLEMWRWVWLTERQFIEHLRRDKPK